MSEVVEGQRPAMSYIPGWNEYVAWSREHRDYTCALPPAHPATTTHLALPRARLALPSPGLQCILTTAGAGAGAT